MTHNNIRTVIWPGNFWNHNLTSLGLDLFGAMSCFSCTSPQSPRDCSLFLREPWQVSLSNSMQKENRIYILSNTYFWDSCCSHCCWTFWMLLQEHHVPRWWREQSCCKSHSIRLYIFRQKFEHLMHVAQKKVDMLQAGSLHLERCCGRVDQHHVGRRDHVIMYPVPWSINRM